MESASQAAGPLKADEATRDPARSSAAPPPPSPPAPPPSKRRWSPCTWRYAIEDAQAELPSRPPRATAPLSGGATAFPPNSSRVAPHSSSQQQQSIKRLAKSSCYNPLYGKTEEEPERISSHVPGLPAVVESPTVRSSASQPPAHFKNRPRELHRKSHHQHLLSTSKARPLCEKDDQQGGGDAEQDTDDYNDEDEDDDQFAVYDEEYFKMRRREMSPTELYFCATCSTKAAETKGRREPCVYDSS